MFLRMRYFCKRARYKYFLIVSRTFVWKIFSSAWSNFDLTHKKEKKCSGKTRIPGLGLTRLYLDFGSVALILPKWMAALYAVSDGRVQLNDLVSMMLPSWRSIYLNYQSGNFAVNSYPVLFRIIFLVKTKSVEYLCW